MTEDVDFPKFVLRWRHKNLDSMHGNVDYASSSDALEGKKREMQKTNPHLTFWIDRYLGG